MRYPQSPPANWHQQQHVLTGYRATHSHAGKLSGVAALRSRVGTQGLAYKVVSDNVQTL